MIWMRPIGNEVLFWGRCVLSLSTNCLMLNDYHFFVLKICRRMH